MTNKKDIVLSVVGILAGLALTYLLWLRSQAQSQAQAAAAQANAYNQEIANEQQYEQEAQFSSEAQSLYSSGASTTSNATIEEPTSNTDIVSPDESDLSNLINTLLDGNSGTVSTIPASTLLPEIDPSSLVSSLANVPITASEATGNTPSAVTGATPTANVASVTTPQAILTTPTTTGTQPGS